MKVKKIAGQKKVPRLIKEPFSSSFKVALVFWLIFVLTLFLRGKIILTNHGFVFPPSILISLCIAVLLWLVLGLILKLFFKAKTISFSHNGYRGFDLGIRIRVRDGKVVEVSDNNIIWRGKPSDSIYRIDSFDHSSNKEWIWVNTNLSALTPDGFTKISLSVSISITLNDDFDPNEIYQLACSLGELSTCIRLDDLIIRSFKIAIEQELTDIQNKLLEYQEQTFNQESFSNYILGKITLPKLFSNFVEYQIRFGAPTKEIMTSSKEIKF